jgi:hypothetical protein
VALGRKESFMASAVVRPAARAEWAPANPWFWMLFGLVATAAGLLLALAPEPPWKALRFPAIALGLVTTGAAIWRRLACSQPAFVEGWLDFRRQQVLAALAAVGLLMVLATSVPLVQKLAGVPEVPWDLASLLFMWILVAPWGIWLALTFVNCLRGPRSVSRAEECAALLTLASLVAFGSSWALYLGAERPDDWDSVRLALAALALVALVAGPLAVVSTGVRRAVVGILIMLHFGGIVIAVLSAAPTPWLVGQTWALFYRPYLDFMYLNNAYHFYAPEPGPASSLWFRIESVDNQKKVHSHWLKIPDMDDNTGQPRYALALEYQRMLALTENTQGEDQRPPRIITEPDGTQQENRYYHDRIAHAGLQVAKLGADKKDPGLIIPFHPQIPPEMQCRIPDPSAWRYLKSFVRFVMHRAAVADPARTPFRVKVYRVTHTIPDPDMIAAGMDPCYPLLYLPYYMGEFDKNGEVTAEGAEDPFLYWVLPIIKIENRPDAEILMYVFLHAGEHGWKVDTRETKLKTKLKLPEDT